MNLFIDCTQKNFYLCLFNKEILDSKITPTNNNLTDISINIINSFFKKNNIKNKDIKNIYLVVGPGSFTGVRVGCIIANLFKDLLKTNIYTISSLKIQMDEKVKYSIIDAKSNKKYFLVRNGKEKILENKVIEKIINKSKDVVCEYEHVDIFKNLLLNIKKFKRVKCAKPLYLKKAVN
jgi:tRNA threonylcarbamoyl adenosine modification protein YeaZ